MDDHGLERLGVFTKQQRDLLGTLDVVRFLSCKALTGSMTGTSAAAAADLFQERWPSSPYGKQLELQRKAAMAPGGTTDPVWAGNLIAPPTVTPLLQAVQKEAVPGRAGFRQVPFNVSVPIQTAAGTFAWVGGNAPKPITAFAFSSNVQLKIAKASGIVVLSSELLKLAAPNAEGTIAAALTAGLVSFQDAQLLDPAVTAIADVRPASITNGVVATTVTGDVAARVAAILAALYTSRPGVQKPVLIMTPTAAGQLGDKARVDGGVAYYGVVPVVTTTGAGVNIIAADADAVVYADAGLELDVSKNASVELNDAPVAPTAATVMSSLWQLDLVGVRAERFMSWAKAPGAVQFGAAA
jgi:hypothetical protein